MTTIPIVTVGIPFFNDVAWLNSAIQSVVNQTFQEWELILVDDGSTDGSTAIAESWTTDSRIRLVRDGCNRGQSARLNQITQLARGRYVARMDADDIMVAHRLERQIAFMESNPEVDLVAAYTYSIDARNTVCGWRGTQVLPANFEQAFISTPIVHPSVLVRREWFLRNPYQAELRRAQDRELWLRTILTSRFHVLEEPLLFYRELGLPYASKYRKTAIELCRIHYRYLSQIGWLSFVKYCFTQFCKAKAYYVMSLFNAEDYLLRRRNLPLSASEQEAAQRLLEASVAATARTVSINS